MPHPLVETWQIHDRIDRYLLDALEPDDLAARPANKGRTVADLFGHMHNVRLMWLKSAAPDLLDGLEKIEPGSSATSTELSTALAESGAGIGQLVERAVAGDGKVKGFKPHVTAFVGYLISHESHHRGQVTFALRAVRRPIDKKVSYGLWEWGVR